MVKNFHMQNSLKSRPIICNTFHIQYKINILDIKEYTAFTCTADICGRVFVTRIVLAQFTQLYQDYLINVSQSARKQASYTNRRF